jgi:tetratricopeptide (TPR) repeat protein
MERQLKTISKSSIPEALSKAKHYRYLKQAEEAESICRDVLAVEPENQVALRLLGLAITDQFTGAAADHRQEAESCFQKLLSPYERSYYLGILHERRAKAQMRAGHLAQSLLASFEKAMQCFEEAERLRPEHNDDALLRWNRCLRLLKGIPELSRQDEEMDMEISETPPIPRVSGRRF